MKRLAQLAFATVSSVALILTGCSQQSTQPGEAKPKVEAKKEPTPVEVLLKSNEVMEKGAFTFEGKMDQKMSAAGQNMDMGMTFDVNMTGRPFAMHMKGTAKMMGQSMPIEMYQVGNEMYQKVGPMGWMKSIEPTDGASGEQPTEIVKKLAKFIEALGGNALPKGIKVTKEGNDYLVETDYTELQKNKEFEKDVLDAIKESVDPESLKKDGIVVDLSKAKVSLFKEKVWIDGATFQTKKFAGEMKLTVPAGKAELKMDSTMEFVLKGEFNGKIEVPEQVKKSAKQG
jgi:hypothetical protein